MNKATLLRRALWFAAFFNAGGSVFFFFPESIGRLAGVPLPAPILYSWFSAAMIAIFAGAYAWLARQEHPSRPLIVVSAIGKISFIAICVIAWLAGESSGRLVAIASIDIVPAAIFIFCLPKPAHA